MSLSETITTAPSGSWTSLTNVTRPVTALSPSGPQAVTARTSASKSTWRKRRNGPVFTRSDPGWHLHPFVTTRWPSRRFGRDLRTTLAGQNLTVAQSVPQRSEGIQVAITLAPGDPAPEFELPDQDGNVHRSSEYRGRTVVLYFYPRDDTPGCTAQACSFRDAHDEIAAEGAVVLGISSDDAHSHRNFRDNHALPFPLLVDEDAQVAKEYGAWGEKVFYGRRLLGLTRSTFVIGPDGSLLKVWKRARPKEHGPAVLRALRSLK
ncbi:MAG: thioredoxin-dependent thiol peroxidase [Chloroflexi bacterium]|nr:thioredoxin-dependent thiol peroxidase [Chloroflexota bacterium]